MERCSALRQSGTPPLREDDGGRMRSPRLPTDPIRLLISADTSEASALRRRGRRTRRHRADPLARRPDGKPEAGADPEPHRRLRRRRGLVRISLLQRDRRGRRCDASVRRADLQSCREGLRGGARSAARLHPSALAARAGRRLDRSRFGRGGGRCTRNGTAHGHADAGPPATRRLRSRPTASLHRARDRSPRPRSTSCPARS